MKFHLLKAGKAACGAVPDRPDTFLFDDKGFAAHYAKEYQCKNCLNIYERQKRKVN